MKDQEVLRPQYYLLKSYFDFPVASMVKIFLSGYPVKKPYALNVEIILRLEMLLDDQYQKW